MMKKEKHDGKGEANIGAEVPKVAWTVYSGRRGLVIGYATSDSGEISLCDQRGISLVNKYTANELMCAGYVRVGYIDTPMKIENPSAVEIEKSEKKENGENAVGVALRVTVNKAAPTIDLIHAWMWGVAPINYTEIETELVKRGVDLAKLADAVDAAIAKKVEGVP